MKPKFMSSTDSNEKRTVHTKNDNIEIMIGKDTAEIIQKRFDSFLDRYQEGRNNLLKVVVVCLAMDIKEVVQKVSGVVEHIDSPEWIKTNKSYYQSNK